MSTVLEGVKALPATVTVVPGRPLFGVSVMTVPIVSVAVADPAEVNPVAVMVLVVITVLGITNVAVNEPRAVVVTVDGTVTSRSGYPIVIVSAFP
jgi:hypothetical protein